MNYKDIRRGPSQDIGEFGFSDSVVSISISICPERISKVLVKRGWCHTEYGWGHEKISPVYVPWKEAFEIQLSLLSPVPFAGPGL
jgi:hypothetical protein